MINGGRGRDVWNESFLECNLSQQQLSEVRVVYLQYTHLFGCSQRWPKYGRVSAANITAANWTNVPVNTACICHLCRNYSCVTPVLTIHHGYIRGFARLVRSSVISLISESAKLRARLSASLLMNERRLGSVRRAATILLVQTAMLFLLLSHVFISQHSEYDIKHCLDDVIYHNTSKSLPSLATVSIRPRVQFVLLPVSTCVHQVENSR